MNFLNRSAQLFQKPSGLPDTAAGSTQIEAVLAIVFQIAAAIAVLIIAIAGFTYVISQGDPQRINKAKDAILYAIIGLVVSILGYTIVAFVLGRVA